MLASYISAVLCSLIASFIDVLSLTVQCRPCSFGEALHLGAYPGTHLHVRTGTATSSTMSRLEAVTTELSAMRPELERLQAENARLREDRPERAAEIDGAVEAERLRELYAQALQDIQAKEEQIVAARSDLEAIQEQLTLRETTVQKWQAKCESLEKTCDTARAEADQIGRKFPYARPLLKYQHPRDHCATGSDLTRKTTRTSPGKLKQCREYSE